LAKNADGYQDTCTPGFEYSEKAKKIFLDIGMKLHHLFPEGYIVFADEFHDVVVSRILRGKNSREDCVCDEYEFVIVTQSDKRPYLANGRSMEMAQSKIFISKHFLPEDEDFWDKITKRQ